MNSSEIPQFVLRNLERAWIAIADHFDYAENNSKSTEGGISVFKMEKEKVEREGKLTNCTYMFIEKQSKMFNDFLESTNNERELKRVYDPDSTFLVGVSVPWYEDHSINEARVYRYDTREPL